MKDVQAESAVGLPVDHRLEGDDRQPPIDGDLSRGEILHAVWPTPDDLSHLQFGYVLGLHFGYENDVAVGDELASSPDPTDEVGQLFVSGAKVGAVAML